MTDIIKTHAAQLLADNLHPHRIVLLEEYGDRVLHMTLSELEAFEQSSGYIVEDIIPDFMMQEIIAFLWNRKAFIWNYAPNETSNT